MVSSIHIQNEGRGQPLPWKHQSAGPIITSSATEQKKKLAACLSIKRKKEKKKNKLPLTSPNLFPIFLFCPSFCRIHIYRSGKYAWSAGGLITISMAPFNWSEKCAPSATAVMQDFYFPFYFYFYFFIDTYQLLEYIASSSLASHRNHRYIYNPFLYISDVFHFF